VNCITAARAALPRSPFSFEATGKSSTKADGKYM
jgi:hypothetical protein